MIFQYVSDNYSNYLNEIFEITSYFNLYRPDPGRKEKNNLNFYFHTSLWCLKRLYEGLKDLHKNFCGTTKKCGNNKLS